MPAGALRELFAFDKRVTVDDGYGNSESSFAEVFRCPASATPLVRGRDEAVTAARLTGIQPWAVAVRYTALSVTITTDWRARNLRTGAVYNITAAAPRPRRDYVDFVCTQGTAA